MIGFNFRHFLVAEDTKVYTFCFHVAEFHPSYQATKARRSHRRFSSSYRFGGDSMIFAHHLFFQTLSRCFCHPIAPMGGGRKERKRRRGKAFASLDLGRIGRRRWKEEKCFMALNRKEEFLHEAMKNGGSPPPPPPALDEGFSFPSIGLIPSNCFTNKVFFFKR